MLDERLPAFDGQDRLIDMVVGLLSWGDRIARLALIPRVDAGRCTDGPGVDFLLGVLSLRRTLRAVLSTADRAATGSSTADASVRQRPAAAKPRSRILR